MANRKKAPIIIANWKMNGLLLESMQLFKELRKRILDSLIGCEVVICPPFTLLRDMAEKVPGTGVKMGGQNCHHMTEGAFTGEISAKMLKDMKCDYVILGHSERRVNGHEGSEIVQKKAKSAIQAKLSAVICVGETRYEHDNDLTKIVLREQITHSIPQIANHKNIVVAYEPVWAIGTGVTPSLEQIMDVHKYIRDVIENELKQFSEPPRVIYGGSITDDNSESILSAEGIDGLLVGKASLDINKFWKIIESVK